jgi:ArsR family transcriptional regulator
MFVEISERNRPMTDMARIFKALGDPTRLAIFELIRAGGGGTYSEDELTNTVSWIADRFDVSLSTVSHHLKELRTAGLIRCTKRGQTVHCSFDPNVLREVDDFLRGVKV